MGTTKGKVLQAENPVSIVHVFATEMAETLAVIRPFFVWPFLTILAEVMKHFWPDSSYVMGFLAISVVVISVLMWIFPRTETLPEYIHGVFTAAGIGVFLGMVDALGWNKTTWFVLLLVLPAILLTWSVRGIIIAREMARGQYMTGFFHQAGMKNTHIKLPATRKNKRKGKNPDPDPLPDGKQRRPPIDKRIQGTVHLPPGETPETVVDNLRKVESAAGLPPGAITVTPNLDHAGVGDVTLSDPRVIAEPVDYPGPSYIGGSIADPVSVGMYQDNTETEFCIPGTQIQIMGQIGSGKSLGAGWSLIGEIITRKDAVVWGIDTSKGHQTLGPLAPALHRVATTDDEAREMLSDAWMLVKARTNYFAEHGYSKWVRDCGLQYLVIWVEEVPELVRALGKDKSLWVRLVKNGRSAGISVMWSLQRADFREIPTITRGQAVKWCFGVSDEKEAKFGLSTAQIAAGCEPQLWGQRRPGMSFLDAPDIPDFKVPLPLRAWYWGENNSVIKVHAEKYPASGRPYDEVTTRTLGNLPETANKIPAEKMDTSAARMHMRAWVLKNKSCKLTNPEVIAEALKGTGYGKAWAYKVMHEFENEGLVYQDATGEGTVWIVETTSSS